MTALKSKMLGLVPLVGGALRANPEQVEYETAVGPKGLIMVYKIKTPTATAVISVGVDEPSVIVVRTEYSFLLVEGERFKLDLFHLPTSKEVAKDLAYCLFILIKDEDAALDEESRRNFVSFRDHWNSL
jgi:hypothetical protein